MINILGAAALAFMSAQSGAALQLVQQPEATAPLPELPMPEATALRCATAFGLATKRQKHGDATALQWPNIEERGREFFVNSLQQIMLEHDLAEQQVQSLVIRELADLEQPGKLADVMPGCLLLLDASGL